MPKNKKLDELTEDLKRIQADFVNYKNRTESDRQRSFNSGQEQMVLQLLPILDDLSLALNSAPKELANHDYVKGIQAVAKRLQATLTQLGVEEINALDQEFDAESMDAVEVSGDGDKEIVSEVVKPGYTMNDQILRHAMVKVRKEK